MTQLEWKRSLVLKTSRPTQKGPSQMALTTILLALLAGVLWRESSGVVQTNFPELPLLKVKGTHFQLGLQSVRDHTKHTAFNHAYQRLDDN